MTNITKQDVREALNYPSDFGYSGDNNEMFVTWSLGPVIRTRDSDILESSNAAALEEALDEATRESKFPKDDYEITSCNHWAVGWVDHLSFRAIESEETLEPTAIFHWLRKWFNTLADYPIADENDYSERQYEYAFKALDDVSFYVTTPRVDMDNFEYRSEEPNNWKEQVLARMTECPTEEYCNEDEAKRIAFDLGFLTCNECEGDGWVYDHNVKIPIPLDPNGNMYARQGYRYKKVNCKMCDGTGVDQGKHTQEEIDEIDTHNEQIRD